MNPSDYHYILFDWDGTLCDTRMGILIVAHLALLEWGMPEEEIGDLGRLTGPTFPYAFSEVYGVSPQEAREISEIYHDMYDSLGPESRPLFAGVPEMLAKLKNDGRVLAIASTKREYRLQNMVKEAGLYDFFDVVVGAVHPERVNKEQVISLTALLLGTNANECLMVGDRFYDVVGAREAGAACAGANFGTAKPGELAKAGAIAVANNVSELERILGV